MARRWAWLCVAWLAGLEVVKERRSIHLLLLMAFTLNSWIIELFLHMAYQSFSSCVFVGAAPVRLFVCNLNVVTHDISLKWEEMQLKDRPTHLNVYILFLVKMRMINKDESTSEYPALVRNSFASDDNQKWRKMIFFLPLFFWACFVPFIFFFKFW